MFLVPSSPWFGKIYWTSGYNSNVTVKHQVPSIYNIEGIRILNTTQVSQLQAIAGGTDYVKGNLSNFWNSLKESVYYTVRSINSGATNEISIDFTQKFDLFPIPKQPGPDQCIYYFLEKMSKDQLPYGSQQVSSQLSAVFNDWKATVRHNSAPV